MHGTLLLFCTCVSAFHLPGVAPNDYEDGKSIPLLVSKLDSSKTQLPFDYFYLNFCPAENPAHVEETLGQVLRGERTEASPYEVVMNEAETCKILCERPNDDMQTDNFKWMIDNEYRANWVLDGLPAGLRQTIIEEGKAFRRSYYQDGFPIGFKMNDKYFVFNHMHLIVQTHRLPSDPQDSEQVDKWRVVGFLVEPMSLQRYDGHPACQLGEFRRFLENSALAPDREVRPSDSQGIAQVSVSYQAMVGFEPQELIGVIPYSYSVVFEDSPVNWASRWQHYLRFRGDSDEVHWLAIINSFAMVLFLSWMVAHILGKTLKTDINSYNERVEQDLTEETGWKQVHGDVFRPPVHFSLLAITVGSGVQIMCMAVGALLFACLGFFSPEQRGKVLNAGLVLYVLLGVPAGYTSTRLYKMCGGQHWKQNSLGTAFLFPGICFTIFFTVNLFIWGEESSGAVPFIDLLKLLVLWLGISVPLVYIGSGLGYSRPAIKNPCSVNRIPKPLNIIPGSRKLTAICVLAGSLPFGCMFIELSFVMKSLWHHTLFYYLFGFLFLCFLVLVVTSAEVSILVTYLLLCREDYRWWWLSFSVSGSSGAYLFLYSLVYYFSELRLTRLSSVVLYFGYMSLVSVAFTLLTGAIGFLATFVFIRKIYGLIKVA